MTFKLADVELLAANPEALDRFCDLMAQRATVGGLEIEIGKLSDSLRDLLGLARLGGLDTTNLINYRRKQKYDWLEIAGYAIGQERGQRLAREAAKQKILAARKLAELHTANLAPFFGED